MIAELLLQTHRHFSMQHMTGYANLLKTAEHLFLKNKTKTHTIRHHEKRYEKIRRLQNLMYFQ